MQVDRESADPWRQTERQTVFDTEEPTEWQGCRRHSDKKIDKQTDQKNEDFETERLSGKKTSGQAERRTDGRIK